MASYEQYNMKRTQVDLEGLQAAGKALGSARESMTKAYQSVVESFHELDEILWVGADAKDYRDSMRDELEYFEQYAHALERICASCCSAADDYAGLQQQMAAKLPAE